MDGRGAALAAALRQAEVSARALRARVGAIDPPSEADLASARPGGPLPRWTHDLGEVLDQIAVAGLAYPDPDLPAALEGLAEQGAALGLTAPVERLLRLAAALRACGPAATDAVRHAAGVTAFETVQRLIAWLRLFRREQALVLVDARLAEAQDEARAPQSVVPTRSVEAWVDGLVFTAGRLTFLARDRADGSPVLIRDSVPDFDPVDPFARPYLSRLFQAEVHLDAVLSGLVVFDAHPVSTRRGAAVFAPAFKVAPTIRSVTAAFEPPPLPPAQPGSRRPGLIEAEWRKTEAGPVCWLVEQQVELAIAEAPLLTLNAVKALTLHERLRLTLCVSDGPEGARVLHARLADGARIFPAADPTVLRWTPEALVRAAADAPAWLRAAAAVFGGAATEDVTDLRRHWPTTLSVPRCWQAAWLRRAIGAEAPTDVDEGLGALLDLALLACRDTAQCTPAELGRVLGIPAGALGGARARIPGRIAYMTVWLVFATGTVEQRLPALRALFQARYATLGGGPSAHDVCARALLMAAFADESVADGDGEPEDRYTPITGYLQTHLQAFTRRPGQAEPQPLPDLNGVLAFADTWALLTEADPRAHTVARLGFDRVALGMAIARALYAWRREGAPSAVAADALWVAALSGLSRWFVAPAGTELFLTHGG